MTYSMRFDLSLQNFKKSLVDIFSPQIERKKRCDFFLTVERKLWAIFSLEFIFENSKHREALGFKHKDLLETL